MFKLLLLFYKYLLQELHVLEAIGWGYHGSKITQIAKIRELSQWTIFQAFYPAILINTKDIQKLQH